MIISIQHNVLGNTAPAATDKAGFCMNSRRWIDFFLGDNPSSCPHRNEDLDCEDCSYYKHRIITQWYKRIWEILCNDSERTHGMAKT